MKDIKIVTIFCALMSLVVPMATANVDAQNTKTVETDEQAAKKLMMAYKREYVFLDQEVRALQKRQIELEAIYTEKKSKSGFMIPTFSTSLVLGKAVS